jgi:aerobic-type carbon monoxide dehydrogenase small subunit (CoxS/CutS family)
MRFVLNGKRTDVPAPPLKRLLDVLREDCDLTGTKEGCGEGECGACTVLLDGAPVNSCLVPFAHARGRRVTTIEGLRSRLPDALAREGGTQCGICTPGVVMAAAALGPRASAARVREALSGNLCRCTGYAGIVRALAGPRAAPRPRVRAAGSTIAGKRKAPGDSRTRRRGHTTSTRRG